MIHQRIASEKNVRDVSCGETSSDVLLTELGLRLKAVYEVVVSQPVPGSLMAILADRDGGDPHR